MSNITSEKVGFSEFEKWLNGRNRWLQTAAKQLIDNKRLPNEDERAELVRLCRLEAANKNDPGFLIVAPGDLLAGAVQRVVRIEDITQVVGVNAIKPGAFLEFGTDRLTAIYGQNGSGKSGFSRLLKQLCGSHSQDKIHPNVFSDEESACSAQCRITIDDHPQSINWNPNAEPHKMLRHAQVFDSKTANQYMGHTESSYEPSSMQFISRLIEISTMVSNKLKQEKEGLISALPQFPSDLSETAAKTWLSSLGASVSAESVEAYCKYEKDLDDERVKTEAILSENDIASRLVAIDREFTATKSIKRAMTQLEDSFSDEKADELSRAKVSAVEARNAANEAAQQAFANAPLQGVGEASWRLMWDQARAYSIAHAYCGHKFPVTTDGERCVLCQQELTVEGATRLKSFDAFVTTGLEAAAQKSEANCTALIEKVAQMPSIESWIAQLAPLEFDEATARTWYNLLESRRAQFLERAVVKDIPVFNWDPINQALEKKAADLLSEKNGLDQLQQAGQRQLLDKRVKQLRGLQWLSQNKSAIFAELERLVAVDLLDKAIRLTATNSLTTKHAELGRTELDAGYKARFNAELEFLGGRRLPVVPQSKAQGKGVIKFGLALVDARNGFTPDDILSEGETRIVALAAFLADTTGSNQLAPFIFDDPISSLDQDFEERVVARLVELAKTRQVIIFTHRLSLIALIEAAIRKHGENSANDKITYAVQSLRRLGKVSGIWAGQNLRNAKPDKALNSVRDQVIPRLKKLHADADAENYDLTVKSTCSDFRIILERIVENILLSDVVIRFRRDVTTKGRLRKIAKVEAEDCDFIDRLMSEYSVYEHSQADELPQVSVELDDFERDVLELIQWVDEFKIRVKDC